jgi:hypothetical protein
VTWVRTTTGASMPVDAMPTITGNLELRQGIAHVVGADPDLGARRYTSHFATCPHADEHRRKKP